MRPVCIGLLVATLAAGCSPTSQSQQAQPLADQSGPKAVQQVPDGVPDESQTLLCSYWNDTTKALYDGKCTLYEYFDEDITVAQAGPHQIIIKSGDRQGVWARVNMNGEDGMRFETDRYTYSIGTLDLKQTFSFAYPH